MIEAMTAWVNDGRTGRNVSADGATRTASVMASDVYSTTSTARTNNLRPELTFFGCIFKPQPMHVVSVFFITALQSGQRFMLVELQNTPTKG